MPGRTTGGGRETGHDGRAARASLGGSGATRARRHPVSFSRLLRCSQRRTPAPTPGSTGTCETMLGSPRGRGLPLVAGSDGHGHRDRGLSPGPRGRCLPGPSPHPGVGRPHPRRGRRQPHLGHRHGLGFGHGQPRSRPREHAPRPGPRGRHERRGSPRRDHVGPPDPPPALPRLRPHAVRHGHRDGGSGEPPQRHRRHEPRPGGAGGGSRRPGGRTSTA